MPTNLSNFQIQQALNRLVGSNLVIDGHIGPKTLAALSAFQDKFKIAKSSDLRPTFVLLEQEYNKIQTTEIVKPTQSNQLGLEIVKCAKQYIGLKEVKSNTAWDDPKTPGPDARAAKMAEWLKRAGHQDGWAYCMSLSEGIIREALQNLSLTEKYTWLLNALNPSVMNSFNNLNTQGKISRNPIPGSLAFMQSGSSGNGHAFIVERLQGNVLLTIEGNTSLSGATIDVESDRNGDWVISKTRPYSFNRSNGLWLRGFWNPA